MLKYHPNNFIDINMNASQQRPRKVICWEDNQAMGWNPQIHVYVKRDVYEFILKNFSAHMKTIKTQLLSWASQSYKWWYNPNCEEMLASQKPTNRHGTKPDVKKGDRDTHLGSCKRKIFVLFVHMRCIIFLHVNIQASMGDVSCKWTSGREFKILLPINCSGFLWFTLLYSDHSLTVCLFT